MQGWHLSNVLFQMLGLCMAQFDLLPSHPPSGNPQEKSSPLGPGVGNCLKQSCPRGMRVGQIKNNFSLMLHITCYFSHGLYKAVQLKTTYFKGKMPKSGWRGINDQDKSLYFQVYFEI